MNTIYSIPTDFAWLFTYQDTKGSTQRYMNGQKYGYYISNGQDFVIYQRYSVTIRINSTHTIIAIYKEMLNVLLLKNRIR